MTGTAVSEHFDAVVVGSGFGGSVTAYRLAGDGKRVRLHVGSPKTASCGGETMPLAHTI